MPALSIPIHELDDSGKDYVFALDAAWYEQALGVEGVRGDATAGPGVVEVHAQRNGREILVHGSARARLLAQCGRCLGDVPVDVRCDLAALYAPVESKPRRATTASADEDDVELDPGAPDREFYSGEAVAIDDLVRDYLVLELPMQPRCEAGCELPGKATEKAQPGRDAHGEEPIDPRLMPLKKLAQRGPDKE